MTVDKIETHISYNNRVEFSTLRSKGAWQALFAAHFSVCLLIDLIAVHEYAAFTLFDLLRFL